MGGWGSERVDSEVGNGMGGWGVEGGVEEAIANPHQAIRHILYAAFAEVAPQLIGHRQRHRGVTDQVGGGAIVAGQHHQGSSGFGCYVPHHLQAVGPVGAAPQQAHHDDLGVAQHVVGVGIDGQLLLKL